MELFLASFLFLLAAFFSFGLIAGFFLFSLLLFFSLLMVIFFQNNGRIIINANDHIGILPRSPNDDKELLIMIAHNSSFKIFLIPKIARQTKIGGE